MKNERFKRYLDESLVSYVVAAVVLAVIGIIYVVMDGNNVLFNVITIVIGILLVIAFIMFIEYTIWKKHNK